MPEHWHWGVLEDLRILGWLRSPATGLVQPGQRDLFGHIGACQLARVVGATQLWHEIRAWAGLILPANYVGGMAEGASFERHCSTLFNRTQKAASGEKVFYEGRLYSPVYTYRKNTIIDRLGVTSTEMRFLTRLIDDAEKKRRARKAWGQTHTGESRVEWLQRNATTRTCPWEAEGISRATWYRHKP